MFKDIFKAWLDSADEAHYTAGKKIIVGSRKEILEESKVSTCAKTRKHFIIQLNFIKKLFYCMSYKIVLESDFDNEYFIGQLRYSSMHLILNVVIRFTKGEYIYCHCRIYSIVGTNIKNLLYFYENHLTTRK